MRSPATPSPLRLPERVEPPPPARPPAPPAQRAVAALALILALGCCAAALLAAFVTLISISSTGIEAVDLPLGVGAGLTVTSVAALLGAGTGVWWSGRTLWGERLLVRALTALAVSAVALAAWYPIATTT